MPDYATSPFHRFQGHRILLLIVLTALYSMWFTTAGPFGQLTALGVEGIPLETRGIYSGADAVAALGRLDEAGQRTKLIALVFDVPYMILNALVFEALIGFGMRRFKLTGVKINLLFILPLAFLLCDFAEDSFIALTLVTGSETLGSAAAVATVLKFVTYIAAAIAALLLGVCGLLRWLMKRD